MSIELVPATAELLRAYYGEQKLPTTQAFVVLEDDKPVGVVGFIRGYGGVRALYSDTPRERHKAHAKTVMKVMRKLMAIAEDHKWLVVAECDEKLDPALCSRFLERFGFKLQEDGEYMRWTE